jgi:hypothetical protein
MSSWLNALIPRRLGQTLLERIVYDTDGQLPNGGRLLRSPKRGLGRMTVHDAPDGERCKG